VIDCDAPAVQVLDMRRREFSSLLLGAGACASTGFTCAPPLAPTSAGPPLANAARRREIRGICFDLFTLFDPRGVIAETRKALPEGAEELCEAWRSRQFQYSWLRAAAGQYRDFRVVTREALDSAIRARNVALSEAARESLVDAYSRLEPWPDTRAALLSWKQAGLRLAPLANYSPRMLQTLLDNAGLSELFDAKISTDAARTFKPDPRAYALGIPALGLEREEIVFSAFGGWDAAGAKWFGYPTFWVNRLDVPAEGLAPGPDATGQSLGELAAFVAAGPATSG
jgi:2-haloacid dehalogenase